LHTKNTDIQSVFFGGSGGIRTPEPFDRLQAFSSLIKIFGSIALLFISCYNTNMDERIKISKKQQIDFLQEVKVKSQMDAEALGIFCNVSGHTVRDWSRAKYTLPHEVGLLLSSKFKVSLPMDFKILKRYWYIKKYARKGALARQKIYGLLGSVETRRKGGLISQEKRRKNPEKYLLLGCKARKQIKPFIHSLALAELCGIILGDGGITNTQISVTLNKFVDKEYASFVEKLLFKIFNEHPYQKERKSVIVLVLSGVNLVEALEKVGLKRGNKVSHQVGIPSWILKNKNYSRACLRGLMDTDGCVYFHNHLSGGIKYQHLGLNFSNYSRPLVLGAYKILSRNGIKASLLENKGVWVYSLGEIKKYFKIIGSSNQKHIIKFQSYVNKIKIPT